MNPKDEDILTPNEVNFTKSRSFRKCLSVMNVDVYISPLLKPKESPKD